VFNSSYTAVECSKFARYIAALNIPRGTMNFVRRRSII